MIAELLLQKQKKRIAKLHLKNIKTWKRFTTHDYSNYYVSLAFLIYLKLKEDSDRNKRLCCLTKGAYSLACCLSLYIPIK